MKTCFLALLAGAAYVALGSVAHAQYTVIDPSAISHSAQQAAQALAQATQQLDELERQYTQLQETYATLAHVPDAVSIMPGLSVPTVQNPLGNVNQVMGVIGGTSAGSVGASQQQFLAANRYYAPQGNDATAQEMNREAEGTAGVQALAYQNLQSTQQRMNQLPQLQAQLDNSHNSVDLQAVSNRIQVEQQFVATQQAQAQQLQLLQASQDQVSQQRLQQKQRQDADSLFNDTAALN